MIYMLGSKLVNLTENISPNLTGSIIGKLFKVGQIKDKEMA